MKCGHCGKRVRGKLEHLRAKHGGLFYAIDLDDNFYDYRYLREVYVGLDRQVPTVTTGGTGGRSLSEYTDAEIAAEHHRRMMQKLGDQSAGVSFPR